MKRVVLPGGRLLLVQTLLVLVCSLAVSAQTDYGHRLGRQQGAGRIYGTTGPTTLLEALDPTVHRWYLPQELFSEYGRRQWHYTNYAREPYLRYLSRGQEGLFFYDVYGNFTTRGWLVYDWRQTQPLPFDASQLTKPGRYDSWFQRLLISSDASGDYNYSIIIGDEINATLTPMTFRKAGFNGVVANLGTSRFQATSLFSRVSAPSIAIDPLAPTASVANFTNLVAGRLQADILPHLSLGLTLVNAHNGNGSSESFKDNPFQGSLTTGQLERRQNLIIVRLGDDSPEDGEGGAILFAQEVEIALKLKRQIAVDDSVAVVAKDTLIAGSSIGFRPLRQGGKLRDGFLTADGAESITLKYVLAPEEGESEESSLRLALQRRMGMSLAEAEDAISSIENVRFHLLMANDYRIEVSSDRQTNAVGQPQFLIVAQAPGNIKNRANQREIIFDYGLPTANQLFGISAEVRNFRGFDFYGEFNLNNQYRKYPGISAKSHRAFAGTVGDEQAIGWMANLSKRAGPWHLFAEAFGMDATYTTSVLPVDSRGVTDYSPEATVRLYDFVDDNDDQDRHPDQLRIFQGSLIPLPGERFRIRPKGSADPAVFPGYDENGDFISDFNQNSNGDRENFFPDYEEPFLRYYSDRPDFLFGVDLNNNGWIDRFENDDLPDYPYKKDHWGHNLYASLQFNPQIKLTVGRLHQTKRQDDRRNTTMYGLFTFSKDWPGRGKLRLFDMLKKARDTIADPLSQWILPPTQFGQPAETSGLHIPVPDALAAKDTYINTFYADWEQSTQRWASLHRFKWEIWQQAESGDALSAPGSEGSSNRRTSGFLGLINKIEYLFYLGPLSIAPKFKSEFLRQVPFTQTEEKQRSWDALFFLTAALPLLRSTEVEMGVEHRQFFDLQKREDGLGAGRFSGDFGGWVLALQLTTQNPYQGYELTTQLGLRFERRTLEVVGGEGANRSSGLAFLSIFAGF